MIKKEIPKFSVGVYVPAGESLPVLVPIIGGQFIGPVARVGEANYDLLLAACDGNPQPIFQCGLFRHTK